MILILYATQTGNAQNYAEELGRNIPNSMAIAIDEYQYINLPEEQMVFFIISTTGDGEIPNQMAKFWQFLLIKDLPTNSLQKVKFSVFGLGDSSYPKFNYSARKLRSRLLQLSAKEFIPSAFGDEQHPCGLDTEFMPWMDAIASVCGRCTTTEPSFTITETQPINQPELQLIQFTDKKLLSAPGHTKETYQFIFQSNNKYECGDVLSIKPKNSSLLVQKFLAMMDLQPDYTIKLNVNQSTSKTQKLPKIIQLNTLFTEFLDLTSPPNRYFIHIMSQFAELDIHKQKLQEMSQKTPESLEEYYSYVFREKRNVVEVLYDFQPCKIPLPYLIDSLKLIRERQYSISSAYDGNQICITVALVSYTTGKNRSIKGFCTNYLNNLQNNELVQGSIKQGSVNFPHDVSVPVIMVGPGTGVAPFIGFIQKRLNSTDKSRTVLFFGSCYKDKEFYYEQLLTTAPITLFTAFSRDQKQKVYVQHKILENKEFIRKVVESNKEFLIVVTGTSRKMPSQVEQAFKDCLGDQIVQLLKRRKQYLVECW